MHNAIHNQSLELFYKQIDDDNFLSQFIESQKGNKSSILNYLYTHLFPDPELQYQLGSRTKYSHILRSLYYPTFGKFNTSITRLIGLNKSKNYETSSLHPLKQDGYFKSNWKVSCDSLDHLTSELSKIQYQNSSARRKLIEHELDMLSWPITKEILNHKQVRAFLLSYYGFFPLVVGVRSWCTRRITDEEEVYQDAMSWHIDLDFNNHIKVFVFTTDVDRSLGDHQYVQQTHDSFLPKLLSSGGFRRYTSQQLTENMLKYTNLSPVRGQLVIANTRCLHRGTPVSSDQERLIFEITFADSPVGQIRMPLDMYLSINNLK